MPDHLQNIAIIGASGSVGKPTLAALLQQGIHNITIITRPDSNATFPAGATVKRGSYSDAAFMQSALQGQDVLILMLAFAGLSEQGPIVEKAAKAGVKYVIPSEYGMDGSVEKVKEMMPMMAKKAEDLRKVRELGMGYIAVVTSLWTDYLIDHRLAGIDVVEKKATVYTDTDHFHTTTTTQVGRGIAAMLSLPAATIEKEFANKSLFLSSFQVTHSELFEAVLKASNTSESEWTVEKKSKEALLEEGNEKVKSGNFSGHWDLLYYATYTKGLGADYVKGSHNEMLGLPKEDLNEVARAAVGNLKNAS